MKIVSTGRTLFSPENYERKKKMKKRRAIIWSAGIFAILVALVIISRIGSLQISEIRTEGAKVISGEEIARVAKETLSGSYLWLVPRSNAAIYPRGAVKSDLMREFPRVSSVSLSLEGANSLFVTVTERDPYELYCPELGAQCFFLDESGFIFDEAPDFSGVVYFIYTKDAPIENPKGNEFLPSEKFVPLARFVERLPELGFEPVSLTLKDRDAELVMRSGARMLFGAYGDLAFLHSNLEAFLNSPEIKSDKNFAKRVKSLDLRTENKVFWTLE